MNPVGKAAAVAGGLVSAAAITMAAMVGLHHATPVSTVTGTGTGTTASTGTGTSTGQSASGGSSGSGGSQSGTGTGSSGGSTGTDSAGSGGTSKGSSGSGGSSGSSGGHSGVIHPVISGLPHMIFPLVTAIPSPTGTIGDPGVPCLQGYVWRQAYSGDYVCVTPASRTQAADDNAAALGRVQSGGGAYGKYTCIQGYVWRQVVPDDYTCVTPAVRSQAWYDNSQAANRVALFNLWVTDWTPPSQSGSNCNGNVCTTTSGGWDGPNFQVNGDDFNFGKVLVQIRSNTGGAVLWSQTITDGSYTGYTGASFGVQTQIGDCTSVPGTTSNDYVIAYDEVSGRWSSTLPIDSDCASL